MDSASKRKHYYNNALTTLQQILDKTIKNIESEEQLNQLMLNIKKQKLKKIFVSKLMRNLPSRPPYECHVQQMESMDEGKIQGLPIPDWLFHLIVLLAVVSLPLTFVLASFQAFITDFRNTQNTMPHILILKYICLFIYLLKFIAKCIRISWKDGIERIYLTQIISDYISSLLFFFHLVMIILLILFVLLGNNQPIAIIIFVYCVVMFVAEGKDFNALEHDYLQSESAHLRWSLVKIAIFNVLFAHFLSSILLAMTAIDAHNNWMTLAGIAHEPWEVIYYFSFYWATTIMMTVGFGDFLPHTAEEALTTAFIEIFSVIILAYNISEIGSIISRIRNMDQQLRHKLAVFKRMTNQIYQCEGLSQEQRAAKTVRQNKLKQRIMNFLRESQNISSNFDFMEMEQLLEELPSNLRKGFIEEFYANIFYDLPFFANLREETIRLFSEAIQKKFFYPGKIMERTEPIIYILEKGEIGLAYKRKASKMNGKIVQRLRTNKKPLLITHGFLKLVNTAFYTLIAESYSLVWSLHFDSFLEIIAQSQIDSQHYYSILYKHSYDINEWNTIKCQRCSDKSYQQFHTSFECPKLHYVPIKQMVIGKDHKDRGKDQPRRYIPRKRPALSRESTLKHRKTLFIEIEKLDFFVRGIEQNSEDQLGESRIEEENLEKWIKQKLQSKNFDSQDLKKIVQTSLRYYETGYEQDFWDLNTDAIHDYAFFFPNENANRLYKTPINYSVNKLFWRNKSKKKEQLLNFDSRETLEFVKEI